MTAEPAQTPPRGRRLIWPAIALPAVFVTVAIPLINTVSPRGPHGSDHLLFHEPTIRHFARHWPDLCFANYLSATTPLYHVVLAAFAHFVSDDTRALQYAGSLFAVGLLATAALAMSLRAGRHRESGVPRQAAAAEAFAACLPLVASVYVLLPGIWLLPDDAGWWGVLGVLLIATSERWTVWRAAAGGAVLAVLVLARQSHLWTAAPLWVAAWMSADVQGAQRKTASAGSWIGAEVRARWLPAAAALAATVPAFLIVAWFAREWGGLVVPRYQEMYSGFSPSAPAFILSLLGIFSVFFAPYFWDALMDLWRTRRWVIGAVIAAGVLLAAVPQTSFSVEHGRYSGLWGVVRATPLIAGRTSPVFLVLAPLGAVALVAWLNGLTGRDRWINGAALAGFAAAQTVSPEAWQRYYEPMLLILLPLWAFSEHRTDGTTRPVRTGRIAGPIALALLLGAVSAWTLTRQDKITQPQLDPQYVSPEELERTNVPR